MIVFGGIPFMGFNVFMCQHRGLGLILSRVHFRHRISKLLYDHVSLLRVYVKGGQLKYLEALDTPHQRVKCAMYGQW